MFPVMLNIRHKMSIKQRLPLKRIRASNARTRGGGGGWSINIQIWHSKVFTLIFTYCQVTVFLLSMHWCQSQTVGPCLYALLLNMKLYAGVPEDVKTLDQPKMWHTSVKYIFTDESWRSPSPPTILISVYELEFLKSYWEHRAINIVWQQFEFTHGIPIK